ncbi:Dymeclin [Gryllus bimaculatus]|nr:Dymeclin [Gryllus bimaculatus]
MGTSASRVGDLESNEYLARFANKEHISPNDPFWNRLLSFSFPPPASMAENRRLDEQVAAVCRRLLVNNLTSGNLGSLLHVFLGRAGELLASAQTDNAMFGWQTYNALLILRCISKFLVENVKEEDLVRQFEARPQVSNDVSRPPDEGEPRLEVFLDALVELVVDVPVKDFTYAVHVEAVHTLLALLAGPLYSQRPAHQFCVYRSLMQGRYAIHAPLLVKTLLLHFSEQQPAPAGLYRPNSGGGSLVLALASGLWSVLTLGYGRTVTAEPELDPNAPDAIPPLVGEPPVTDAPLANHDRVESQHTRAAVSFRLDMSPLYQALCAGARRAQEECTLLLYLLLHRNSDARTHILARSDLEQLVEPVLRTLYHAPAAGSHHIYMSLIVLLILSEDEGFNRIVHDIMLRQVTWYTERAVSGLSLGGLLVLVVLRTVQFNMLRMRDRYLHTNCLAALANMSAEFRNLHPYVTQRLVSLFESLAKKHARLLQQLAQVSSASSSASAGGSSSDTDGLQEALPAGASAVDPDMVDELGQDVGVLEEVLRMVLEIVNSCLSHQLPHNPNLVYTLLHRRAVFLPFRQHPAFQDITHNIDMVLEFFSSELESAATSVGGRALGVSEVQAAIQRGVTRWPRDRLRKFPDLKFKYVEEEQPEDFFIPYVWSLVVRASGLHWSRTHMKLLLAEAATAAVC